MKVLLFPGSLGTGGAQAQAKILALGLVALGHEVRLVTLFGGGKFWRELQVGGEVVPEALFPNRTGFGAPAGRFSRRWKTLKALAAAPAALRSLARENPPDIILSSLYTSNFLAARAWPAGNPPLLWSVRGSDVPWTSGRRLYFEAGRRLCRRPRGVIYNSHAGRRWHLERGFPRRGATVIINGIDTEVFRRARSQGLALRRRWGISDSQLLVGLVGRLSPMKDHNTFLEAAATVAKLRPALRFVCIGAGPRRRAAKLRRQAEALGLGDRLVWAGEVQKMCDAYNALDVLASSSAYGEGFSNVLAEGMACELPVVATDCGDAALILGDSGRLVPRRRPRALAEALLQASEEGPAQREARGKAARARVVASYSVRNMVEQTESLLESVVASSTVSRKA